MHKVIIHNLGPIKHCELPISHFMTLTGFQASGKSTIAKTIYYFRTIKNDILDLIKKRAVNRNDNFYNSQKNLPSLEKELGNYLREKFMRTFGSSWSMPMDMYLQYQFSKNWWITISLKDLDNYPSPNYLWIDWSDDLKNYLRNFRDDLSYAPSGFDAAQLSNVEKELCNLFDDDYDVVYIPAGRSMITVLSQQLNYIYATMDDGQKRSLDICTKDYLERTLRIKPEFSEGLLGLLSTYSSSDSNLPRQITKEALKRIDQILRGTYRYSNGEEQIVLDDNTYVKLNFSSSGQQECVWILNLLFYYLLQQNRILFIIEEPESHLFPESQKYITELIALVSNYNHSVILTTHSPYVLGTLNNLLYAYNVPIENRNVAEEIIPSCCWLDPNTFSAYFAKSGNVEDCMDYEINMIQNERIDEISKDINEEFDRLLELY